MANNGGCGCGTIIMLLALVFIVGDLMHGCQQDNDVDGVRTVDGVSLIDSSIKLNHDSSDHGGTITGTIKNTTAQPVHNVSIQFRLTDSSGSYAGHANDTTYEIDGGGSWNFSCPIDNASLVQAYQFDNLSADDSN